MSSPKTREQLRLHIPEAWRITENRDGEGIRITFDWLSPKDDRAIFLPPNTKDSQLYDHRYIEFPFWNLFDEEGYLTEAAKGRLAKAVKDAGLTPWLVYHPNYGWVEETPCGAVDALFLLGWPISLGEPVNETLSPDVIIRAKANTKEWLDAMGS